MKTKAYEILFIIKTSFGKDEREGIIEKLKGWITKPGGTISEFTDIGLKDFAMELNKEKQGHYYQCIFQANNKQLDDLNTELKVTEDIFRYLIVLLDSVLTKEEMSQKVTQ